MLIVLIEINCIVDGKVGIIVVFLESGAVTEIRIPTDARRCVVPTLYTPDRAGDTFEVLAIIARINL